MHSLTTGLSLMLISVCCVFTNHLRIVLAGQDVPNEPLIVNAVSLEHDSDLSESTSKQVKHNISVVDNEFVLDGKVLRIVSGSLHYFRLPAAYWRDRLRKLKAAGLNAVTTYVEWSYHEPEEGQYLFENDHDVASFVRIASEEGLYVLLRPGPYICAERDLGGLPYWLLGKYPNIRLRTTNKDFIYESNKWMEKLFHYLTPLLAGNGGPIILVQVENEYGSYSNDKNYMKQIRDMILKHVGDKSVLFTTDGTYINMFRDGSVEGAVTTIDFGSQTNVERTIRDFRKYVPKGPLMNSEYYSGWLTHWNESLQQVSSGEVVKMLRKMLDKKFNINFYMFFGGTNFEFTSGANYGKSYQPDITSYDYDAPLTEAGDPSEKYYLIRNVLAEYYPELNNITAPVASKKTAYGEVTLKFKTSILSPYGRKCLGKKYDDVTGTRLPTFEALRQRGGLILYETTLNDSDAELKILKPHDSVYAFVDGELQGILYRMCKQYTININCKPGSTLSLLVENQGRINYGPHIHDFKGILSTVEINGKPLNGQWSITGYPLTFNSMELRQSNETTRGSQLPQLFEGSFNISTNKRLDTYLDTTGWGKGYIWINGHNLGRYWPSVGPQITLYVPGVWLVPGVNHILVLELEDVPIELKMEFIDTSVLNRRGMLCIVP